MYLEGIFSRAHPEGTSFRANSENIDSNNVAGKIVIQPKEGQISQSTGIAKAYTLLVVRLFSA